MLDLWGGSALGINVMRWNPRASAAALAQSKCPWWMGLNVPPKQSRRIAGAISGSGCFEVDSDAFAMMNSGCKERRWILDRHGIRIAGAKRLRAAAKIG
jgi:hypothetical protein